MHLELSQRTTRSGGTKPDASSLKRGHFLLPGSFQPEAIYNSVIKAPEMQLLFLPPPVAEKKNPTNICRGFLLGEIPAPDKSKPHFPLLTVGTLMALSKERPAGDSKY